MIIPSHITQYVSLANKNWFCTGGSARWYSEPQTIQECSEAIVWAHMHTIPLFFLGLGANTLVSDNGFDGLVIKIGIKTITIREDADSVFVTAGAGTSIEELIQYSLAHNAIGMEEFSGIPGTVGGSVFINIHYFEFFIARFLTQAQLVNIVDGSICTVDKEWFNFGYDYTTLHTKPYAVISATFALKKCTATESAYAAGRSYEIIRHRTHRYPSVYTCGSFFKNFDEKDITVLINGKKITAVAYYLDKLGLKGTLICGGASVSTKHANMIVSSPLATTADIVAVARIMQQSVYEAYGLMPQSECRFLGFDKNPLLHV